MYYQEVISKIKSLQMRKTQFEKKRELVTCTGAFNIYTEIIIDIEAEIKRLQYELFFMEG